MKVKIITISIMLMLLIIIFSGMTIGTNEQLNLEKNQVDYANEEPYISILTDKENYTLGETVIINYKNIGKSVAGFIIGTSRPTIPGIIDSKTGRRLFLTDPSLCYPCVMMYDVLEPAENLEIEWNQQYYGYDYRTFNTSEQVHSGYYYIELEYWKVIGYYNPPYMVPGGPPDKIAISKIFKIEKDLK